LGEGHRYDDELVGFHHVIEIDPSSDAYAAKRAELRRLAGNG
jgi:hypothetical protein